MRDAVGTIFFFYTLEARLPAGSCSMVLAWRCSHGSFWDVREVSEMSVVDHSEVRIPTLNITIISIGALSCWSLAAQEKLTSLKGMNIRGYWVVYSRIRMLTLEFECSSWPQRILECFGVVWPQRILPLAFGTMFILKITLCDEMESCSLRMHHFWSTGFAF